MSTDPDWRQRVAIHKTWTSTITGVTVLGFVAFVLNLFFGGR